MGLTYARYGSVYTPVFHYVALQRLHKEEALGWLKGEGLAQQARSTARDRAERVRDLIDRRECHLKIERSKPAAWFLCVRCVLSGKRAYDFMDAEFALHDWN